MAGIGGQRRDGQVDGKPARGLRMRLRAEFALLFVLVPVGLAVLLPAGATFPVLVVLVGTTLLGVVLLQRTPSFAWRDLVAGRHRVNWTLVAGFAALTLAGSLAVILWQRPEALFGLPRAQPGLWLLTMALYPLLSALPQEVIFRPLFFRRYGPILPAGAGAIVLNAAVFALAHLMFWNWIVLAMTFVGGLVFAWAYAARHSFPLAVLLHVVAGWILFTVGMDVYFFAGNAVRPF